MVLVLFSTNKQIVLLKLSDICGTLQYSGAKHLYRIDLNLRKEQHFGGIIFRVVNYSNYVPAGGMTALDISESNASGTKVQLAPLARDFHRRVPLEETDCRKDPTEPLSDSTEPLMAVSK